MPSPRPPMTKTVVKKVSSNVKVLRPGSKPLTQSNTEKAKIAAKAKTKTPAARSADAARKASAKRDAKWEIRSIKNSILKDKYFMAAEKAGYKNGNLTPAQKKAGNLAIAEEQRKMKAEKLAAKAKTTRTTAKARGGAPRGGNIGSIGGPGMNWETK